MQIFNTASRSKEEFFPIRPGKVHMYVCGVTVYDLCHIGHARSALVFDVLVRFLRSKGLDVTFVRNFTDVDDKIIRRANTENKDWKEIAETYIKAFHEDMDALGIQRADFEPRATENIQNIISICQTLVDQGTAYATPSGDVYFSVRAFPAYGKLSLGRITLENYRFVFTNRGVRQAITNSLALALVTCLVCAVLGTMLAYRKVRLHCPASRLVEQCASLSYAIPGIVLALSMIFHWTAIPGIYGTIRILFIAYITRYLVLQIKSSSNALGALDASLEEASAMCGSSRLRTWGQVSLPLTLKPILSGTFLIFMQSLTELTLSSMLAAAGTKTIGLTIFGLQQGGDDQRAAALSAVIIFAVGGCWVLWALAGCARRWLLAHRQRSLHLAPKAA